MALWQLLILMGFGMPAGTSLAAAEHARGGWVGYALAIRVGLIVGGFCGWTRCITHHT